MALKRAKCALNSVKMAIFLIKNIAQRLHPQTPHDNTFGYRQFAQHATYLKLFSNKTISTFGSSSSSLPNSWLRACYDIIIMHY